MCTFHILLLDCITIKLLFLWSHSYFIFQIEFFELFELDFFQHLHITDYHYKLLIDTMEAQDTKNRVINHPKPEWGISSTTLV